MPVPTASNARIPRFDLDQIDLPAAFTPDDDTPLLTMRELRAMTALVPL